MTVSGERRAEMSLDRKHNRLVPKHLLKHEGGVGVLASEWMII